MTGAVYVNYETITVMMAIINSLLIRWQVERLREHFKVGNQLKVLLNTTPLGHTLYGGNSFNRFQVTPRLQNTHTLGVGK